jgi:prevent-host-death family protein
MAIVNVSEARSSFSALLERAHAGEEITIAKAGKPYARLVRLDPPPERRPGRYSEPVPERFFEPLAKEDLAAWEQ